MMKCDIPIWQEYTLEICLRLDKINGDLETL